MRWTNQQQAQQGGWEQLATKQDLKEFATKQDLKALEESTKQELKQFVTKENLEVGLSTVRAEMREGFAAVQVVLAGMVERGDLPLKDMVAALDGLSDCILPLA